MRDFSPRYVIILTYESITILFMRRMLPKMVTNKKKIFISSGQKMTDRIPYKLGLKSWTSCPEYWGGLPRCLMTIWSASPLSMKQRTPHDA